MIVGMEVNSKFDVAIVGGGLAGMCCALELLRKGKTVILLDRAPKHRFGGLAKESFGGMFFVDTPQQRRAGIKDSADLALRDWISFAEFGPEDLLPKKWAEKYVTECTREVYEWLKLLGISFFPVVHWVERGLFAPGNSVPRFHMVWGTGYGLTTTIEKHLEPYQKTGKLVALFEHSVTDVVISGNRMQGIRFSKSNGEQDELKTDALVIAAGGICGNIDLVKKNWYKPWGSPPLEILNGAMPEADGTLHEILGQKGVAVTHLDKCWHYAAGVHHPRPHFPGHGLSLVPPKSALWLTHRGERFSPIPLMTAYDTRYLVEQVCAQEKKYSWQVMNMKIAVKELAVSGSESNKAMRDKDIIGFLKTILFGNKELVSDLIDHCSDCVVAHSVDELAERMNALAGNTDVEKTVLGDTIRRYDEAIQRGKKLQNDEQLRRIAHVRQYSGDKVRTCNFQRIDDRSAYPLIAVKEHILSRKTLGGIQTDLECRVLNCSGEPVSGLYAIGEAAGFGGGGIHGLRSLEGTFLGTCVLTGRTAAKSIAPGNKD